MKKLILMNSIALIMSTYCLGQNEVTIRTELEILKPLVGKTWVSEDKHPNGQLVLHLLRQLEPMHNGVILKYYGECKELNNQTDGYYYYDADKKEIAFIQLTSNGNVSVGNVKEEDGNILMYGFTIFPQSKLEFRNVYKITPDGELTDEWFRFEDGEWKAGHSRVWTVK